MIEHPDRKGLSKHIDPLELATYARGRLTPERAATVRQHCFGCRDCGDQLAAIILLRRDQAEAPERRRRRRVAIAVAATLVLTIGAAMLVAPDRVPYAVPSERDHEKLLETLEMNRSFFDGALAADSGSTPGGAVRAAAAQLERGAYADAVAALSVTDQTTPFVRPLLGLALYFEQRDLERARRVLQAHSRTTLADRDPRDLQSLDRAAVYYLARIELDLGERGDAVRRLQILLESGEGDYTTAAEELLRELGEDTLTTGR